MSQHTKEPKIITHQHKPSNKLVRRKILKNMRKALESGKVIPLRDYFAQGVRYEPEPGILPGRLTA